MLTAVIVAGASAVVLVAAVHSSTATTASLGTHAEQVGFTASYAQAECLRAEVRGLVPRGATVYLGSGSTAQSQVLSRSVTLWAVPTPDPRQAEWTLTLDNEGGCSGVRIFAARDR